MDALGGKESTSSNRKASSNTGNQQDYSLYLNKNHNQDAMLNSLQDVMKTDSSSMTDVEAVVSNFASSARAGRRNALPDIQSSAATAGGSELPVQLAALSVKEDVKQKDEETTPGQLENSKKEEK
ncbi:cAMP-dependent protein kinase inhibitor beta isoform X1 [Ochotona princeps]|uniref:cAMP-dependent protein kinase inhibitor beta isoform X1 n=2 Tax=Ochotona princeps TaxID=9978 RepID=UPI002714ED9D|nr:cAMP-dependent protein kinase inhibitor beta isoform X1 [Ochotona princeps]